MTGADAAAGFGLDPALDEHGAWQLYGELDFGCVPVLELALRATVSDPWVLDVAGLAFVDVAAMRVIATVARDSAAPVQLRRASPVVRRLWRVAGFERVAPAVRFTG